MFGKRQLDVEIKTLLSRDIMETLIPAVDSTCVGRINVLLGHNAIQLMDNVNAERVML